MKGCRLVLPFLAVALATLPGMARQACAQACPDNVSGKVYTSLPCNVSNSNHNIYDDPCSVFLSAGPSVQGNCGTGSGLPDGDYFFQVTDPSGTVLLSTDPIDPNRRVRITNGLMSNYLGVSGSCVHEVDDETNCGIHAFCPGQISVQLMPFSPTPNSGGEYKVWLTPVGCYDASNADNPKKNFGFVTSKSATDNYKVLPSTPLTITCPNNITVDCTSPGAGGVVVNFADATVTGGVPPITESCSPPSGSLFPVGTTTVTCTVTDFTGATATCTFTVTVSECPPLGCEITCPKDIDQCAPEDTCEATLDVGTPTISDGCHLDSAVRSDNLALTDPYPVGVTTITWTAVDDATGTIFSNCVQTITIKSGKAAVFENCPLDASYECIGDVPEVLVNPGAVDPCTGNGVTVVYEGETQSNPGSSCNNTIVRTWSATTDCFGKVTCVQTITVNDDTPPQLTGCPDPDGGTVQCIGDVPAAPIVTALDNCDGVVDVHFEEVQSNPGSSCKNVITRTWSAQDTCGNPVSCQQVITVNDTTKPDLTGCPEDTTVQCIGDVPTAATVTASDNCDGPLDVHFEETQSDPGGHCNNVITRTWSAQDTCGNVATCTQTITVNDNTAPTIDNCPTAPDNHIIVQGDGHAGCTANVTLPNITASDNCDGVVPVVGTRSDGKPLTDPFTVGDTTITYTATDSCGNTSTSCVITVTVLGCATRTMGFWATHTTALLTALANGCYPSTTCFVTPMTLGELEAISWAQIGKNGKHDRSALGQARLQLGQQLVAAFANCCILSTCPSTFDLNAAVATLNGTDVAAIKALIPIVTAFNQSGDGVVLTPAQQAAVGGAASPQTAQSLANKTGGVIDPGPCYY